MLKITVEEMCALQLVLSFCNVKELLESAMHGFTNEDDKEQILLNKEKSDICWKAIKSFL